MLVRRLHFLEKAGFERFEGLAGILRKLDHKRSGGLGGSHPFVNCRPERLRLFLARRPAAIRTDHVVDSMPFGCGRKKRPGPQGYTFSTLMLAARLEHRKWLVLATAAVTLLCVTGLAIGIRDLELKPGQPFALNSLDGSPGAGPISQIHIQSTLMDLLGGILRAGVLLLLPFAIIHFIRSRSARKQVLMQLLYLLLFSAAILLLSRSFGTQQLRQPELSPPPVSLSGSPPEVAANLPAPPGWLINAISVLGAAALALLGYRLYQTRRDVPPSPASVAAGARQALDDLEAGDRLESVVLRAYYRLCVSSRRRRGVSRAQHQTAREYRGDLRSAGIPAGALDQLTALFEKARYGSSSLNEDDERKSIEALRAILRSLGEV